MLADEGELLVEITSSIIYYFVSNYKERKAKTDIFGIIFFKWPYIHPFL